MEPTTWHVLVEVLQNDAFADVRRLRFFLLAVGAIALMLVAAMIVWMSRSMAAPIQALRKDAEVIGSGNLDHEAAVTTDDEIGELGNAFNEMVARLRATTVSRDYVDGIVAGMTNALVVMTPEGRIATVNQATLDLLGYDEDELVGMSAETIVALEEREKEESGESGESVFRDMGLSDLIRDGAVSNVDRIFLAKDGKEIPVLFSGAVLPDSDGRVRGIVCVATDITERLEAEEALRQAEKMKSLGNLAGGLAHEINNLASSHPGIVENGIEGPSRGWKGPSAHGGDRRGRRTGQGYRQSGDGYTAGRKTFKKELVDISRVVRQSWNSCIPRCFRPSCSASN